VRVTNVRRPDRIVQSQIHMEAPDSSLLSLRNVSFRFPANEGAKQNRVLHDLSMAAPRGGAAVILGHADAGKTTLARILCGLVPRFTGGALDGKILIGGRDAVHVQPYDLLGDVGLVAQDSEEQLITTRCDTEVAFALESLGVPRPEMRQLVAESLALAGLAGFEDRNPATLSGGEKKRLLVACLAAVRPALWILDEALGELDTGWKTRVLDIVNKRGGTALLMESRWSRLSESRGTSFFLLDDGRIRAFTKDSRDASFLESLAAAGIRQGPAREPRRADSKGLLKAEALSFRFEGSGGFTLSIESLELRLGETCALVGRNGSGKSTLGKILCGLLRPRAGRIELQDEWGHRPLKGQELGARVGYLFQNPDHQIYLPSVREELSLGLRRRRLDRGEIERQVQEAANIFGLTDLGAPPALLSYGARRRLQAATFFLLSRDLLILDEIDSGLSYREVESLIDALRERVPGMVLITHDMALARAACDRILVMEDGCITGDARRGHFDTLAESLGPAVRP
jgi:energy-coupling factor transporter ATP-binding protein EcfA2